MKSKLSSFWIIALGLAVVQLLLHFLTYSNYELHRDEMLYFAMGDHLSWGYMSTPPLVGFLAFIIKHALGYSEFGIKVLPFLSGAASIVLVALFVLELGGRRFAVFIACFAYLISPAFLRSTGFFMPVPFDDFFWFLTAYMVLKLVNTGNQKLWLWIGLITAIAFLNKYSIVFFDAALLVALLLSQHRKLLWSKYLVYALVLGTVIVLPNLLWQYNHNFPVISHMAELQQRQLVHVKISEFIIAQLVINFPCLIIWLVGLIVILLAKQERRFQFISLTYIAVVLILIVGKGKFYYTLGAYPMLFATGGYVMEKYIRGKFFFVNVVVLVAGLLLAIAILPLSLPILPLNKLSNYCKGAMKYIGTGAVTWEDGTQHPIPQDYSDMTGWKELTAIVAQAYNKLDEAEKKRCTIYAHNYGTAGAIVFYGHEYGLPEPVSFNDSYIFWAPDSIPRGTVIAIDNDTLLISRWFNNYREYGRVENKYFREDGIGVFICNNPVDSARDFYVKKVSEMKGRYRR